ncbi:DNA-binding SARP family transcriptional activator/tetratricopeptide (TPR) repeat protein [Actinoalloteichus hoggarensis]|uniref:Regulatory protein AfsR n=1 Tax=Actinoalloteichus hoggarensis TaxID=1470176 RepID=A0A221VWU8_9PSEU|nr:BTAD domain-containing putative transcriptional regulator [Actinoalloteichus hoggarensis]ASO18026.1 Regulatory protein AfsR [Actinoalloteichus hoggarensis]MBB5921380.1 DNA-binding SARP family transcriptional activator/tetratricopeptide (TPR) repeat protein [Actinoalloteichus hoggarensis]
MDIRTMPAAGYGLEFRLLGVFEVLSSGTPIVLGSPAMRRLLALLTLNANQVVSVDRIIRVLWTGDPPASVRTILQGYVSRLRKLIGGAAAAGDDVEIVTRSPGYLLRTDPDRIDLHRARELARSAGETTGTARIVVLRAALRLWRGPALAEMESLPLLRATSMSIEEFRLGLVEDRIEAELAVGVGSDLLAELNELVTQHPLRERLTDHLMVVLYRSGRRADALRRYHELRERLADEFGVDPSPQLQNTYQRILRDDPVADDAARSEEQVDADDPADIDRPALAPSLAVIPAQLPPQIGGFVGRESELAVLDSLLPSRHHDVGSRIAVVSGVAGLGKSALAVTWAHRASTAPTAEFPDGQLFASLRGVDPDEQPAAPADVLRQFLIGLGQTADQIPAGLTERVALYRSITAKRRMLVVLDDAVDHQQVQPLLPAAQSCTVLITSRRMLDGLLVTNGARLIRLGPLPAAQAGELVSRVVGDVVLTQSERDRLADLCGNLPLALRITAARLAGDPGLTVGELIDELADERRRLGALRAGDSQISVRGAFELTYRRLAPEAARLFRLVGVHPGVEMSRSVLAAMAGTSSASVAEQLHVLESVHLMSALGDGRFGTHDLIRLYARQLAADELAPAEREAAAEALVDFYLAAAERGRDLIRPMPGSPSSDWDGEPPPLNTTEQAVAWFDAEWTNLLHAARTAVRQDRYESAWRIAWAAAPYVLFRHLLDESTELFDQGLAAARTARDRLGQCLMLRCRVNVDLYRSAQPEEALGHAMEALAIAEEIGDPVILAPTVSSVFTAQTRLGRYEEARRGGERAVALYRRLGDLTGQAMSLNNLAMIDQSCGRTERAYERCLAVLDLYRRIDEPANEAVVLNNLSELAAELADWQAAEDFARRARSVAVSCGASVQEAKALSHLGEVHLRDGDVCSARFRWEQALALVHGSSSPIRAEVEQRLAELAAQDESERAW